jgi:hypothetical protein
VELEHIAQQRHAVLARVFQVQPQQVVVPQQALDRRAVSAGRRAVRGEQV